MTENEAREVESILRQLSEDENIDSYCTESLKSFADDGANAIEFLLEELQRQKDYIDTISEVCSGYSEIGTIKEFKALKDKSIPVIHGKAELELHDKEIRAKVINECAECFTDWMFEKHGLSQVDIREINEIIEKLKKAGAT